MPGKTVSYDDAVVGAYFVATTGVVDKIEASDWVRPKDAAFLAATQVEIAASRDITKQDLLRVMLICDEYLNHLMAVNG